MEEHCFVIMAISEQKYDSIEISYDNLKDNYENVIKPAIQAARPGINVLRADECAVPGTITTDILTHLMYDSFVIADITFPNPNVYYELGLRHCFKPGTILIKNADVKIKAPFDLSHQRYIEYECTPKGIKDLAKQLKDFFMWYDRFPAKPDNQVLHLAQLIKFAFPNYETKKANMNAEITKFLSFAADKPEFIQLLTDTTSSDQEKGIKAFLLAKDHPEMISTLLELGQKSIDN
jgi:hypothetical protein